MTPRPRWFHGRSATPLRVGSAVLVALLLTAIPARAQLPDQYGTDCFRCLNFERLIQVVAGTDPTWPSYDMGASSWAVPGGMAALPVSLDNRAVVGSVRTVLNASRTELFWPVSVETTERTQGFQADWTFDGARLEVHLFSTSGAVIEPGVGPIYRVVCQVSSVVEDTNLYEENPDVLNSFGFRYPDGYGAASVVLDPLGQTVRWCGPGIEQIVQVFGTGALVIDPAAVFETPTLVTSMGPYAQTNVDVHTNVRAVFSEDVLPATVNGSTFTLTGGTRPVTGTVTLSGRAATLNPVLPLEYGTTYTANVTQGVQDLEGNPLPYAHAGWRFKTASTITGVEGTAPEAPSVMAARPNPFGGETQIAYSLPTAAHASVRVYGASGRLIRTLVDTDMPAGYHVARWDGRDTAGTLVSSGIYFLRFAAAGVAKTQRLMLLR